MYLVWIKNVEQEVIFEGVLATVDLALETADAFACMLNDNVELEYELIVGTRTVENVFEFANPHEFEHREPQKPLRR